MTAKKQKKTVKNQPKRYQKKSNRQPFGYIIIGINGTGKSTKVLQVAKQMKSKRTLVITQTGNPEIWKDLKEIDITDKKAMSRFKGFRKVIAMKYNKKTVLHLWENFKNGLLIFDDCKPYIKSNLEHTKGLVELLADFRHLGLDICFVLHSASQVPPDVWSHCKFAFIGKTNRLVTKKIEITNLEEVIEVQKEVNKLFDEAEKSGKNKYGLFKLIKL